MSSTSSSCAIYLPLRYRIPASSVSRACAPLPHAYRNGPTRTRVISPLSAPHLQRFRISLGPVSFDVRLCSCCLALPGSEKAPNCTTNTSALAGTVTFAAPVPDSPLESRLFAAGFSIDSLTDWAGSTDDSDFFWLLPAVFQFPDSSGTVADRCFCTKGDIRVRAHPWSLQMVCECQFPDFSAPVCYRAPSAELQPLRPPG